MEKIARKKRGSKYDDFFERLKRIRVSPNSEYQCAVYKIKDGTDPGTINNRLNAAMRRAGIKPRKGFKFMKRRTVKGNIAIWLERIK